MPGSKKGERRGGARLGHVRKSAKPGWAIGLAAAKGKGGRPKGAKNKPKATIDPEVVRILNKRVPVTIKERELEMYFTVTGRRTRLPKDVMLTAMRYFEENAIEYADVLRANMAAEAEASKPEVKAILGAAVAHAEAQVDKYVAMAVDVAYKAAPYVHPRLAALITNPGGDRNAHDLLQQLMNDLDEAGKPSRYIDHDNSEVAK